MIAAVASFEEAASTGSVVDAVSDAIAIVERRMVEVSSDVEVEKYDVDVGNAATRNQSI